MKKKKIIKKGISNDGLAVMIEDLARSTAGGFNDVNKRLSDLEQGQRKIRGDILEFGDKFPSRFEFDKSLTRIHKLEGKK